MAAHAGALLHAAVLLGLVSAARLSALGKTICIGIFAVGVLQAL